MSRGFSHIETWVFDLDNTLYPPSCRLFDQVDVRMGEFISGLLGVDRVEAKRVQKKFFHAYGTTLRGLMTEHGVDAAEYLAYVHDIDRSSLGPNHSLAVSSTVTKRLKFKVPRKRSFNSWINTANQNPSWHLTL